MTTAEDLYTRDEGFHELAEAWPKLTERMRWKIYLLVVWYVFRSDLARLFNHLTGAARVVLDTLKRQN